ncbi:MAG: alkaline phosphatase, partial [Halorhodospira sp.]
ILMVPDGMSQSVATLARLVKEEPLALDRMSTGLMSTHAANTLITGSAAAGTAMATGYRSSTPHIGMAPRKEDALKTHYSLPEDTKWDEFAYRPLATVLEGAQLQDKATGLVSTSRLGHATPASFAAHIDDRDEYNRIFKHLAYQGLDVALGGGKRHMLPEDEGGAREDGHNLINVLEERGYQLVESEAELKDVEPGDRVWGVFADGSLMPSHDRRFLRKNDGYEGHEQAKREPSLAAMTEQAIDILDEEEDGFFLMVEGSQVDWAGHDQDTGWHLQDFLAFERAVQVALEYAMEDEQTQLVVAPDHNTGGLTLGNETFGKGYTNTSGTDVLDAVERMEVSSGFLAEQIDRSGQDVQEAVAEYWGIHLSDSDLAKIDKRREENGLASAIVQTVNEEHTVFGWNTNGHTGEDVPYWSYGPSAPEGQIQVNEIGRHIADALGLELALHDPEGINQRLLANLEEHIQDVSVDEDVVEVNGTWQLRPGTDLLVREQEDRCHLDGITVYSPNANGGEGATYVPRQAIDIIKNPASWDRHCASGSGNERD